MSVIASKAQRSIFLKLDCRVAALLTMTSLILLSACAHKADLRSPSQIAKEDAQAKEKAARDAQRTERRAKKDAERAAELEKHSVEVSVPEGTK